METMMKALVWTFVHSLWQGLLAAMIAAVIITATKKTRANIRYNLLGLLFMAFLIGSVITFFLQWGLAMEAMDASLIQGSAGMVNTGDINPGLAAILSNWFDQNAVWIVSLWAVFFFVHCLQLFAGLASVQRLRHYQTYPIADEWEARLSQLCRLLDIKQQVSILQSGLVKVPVAIGFFKPLILLPVGLVNHLPTEQVETILLHELGHIRRKDWLVNILQHFAETVFFFNPAIRWISSLIREEREACCDDIVMDHSVVSRNYLEALVGFQEYANQSSYVMAISSRKQYLLHRIQRMVTRENKRLSIGEKLTLVCGFFLFPAFTYIDQMNNDGDKAGGKPVEHSIKVKPFTVAPVGNLNAVFGRKEMEEQKEKESSVQSYITKGLVADTLPHANKKGSVGKGKLNNDPSVKNGSTVEKDKNESELLLEMEQIIKQITIKKESIGAKKQKLMEKEHDIELEKEIEFDRKELAFNRNELKRKSLEYSELKEKENTRRVKDSRIERDAEQKSKQITNENYEDLLKRKLMNKSAQTRNADLKNSARVIERKNLQNSYKQALINKKHVVDNRKYAVDNRKLVFERNRKLAESRRQVLDNKRPVIQNRKGVILKLDPKPVDKPAHFKKPVYFNSPRKTDSPEYFDQKIRKSPPVPPAPVPVNPKEPPPVKIMQ